MEDIKHLYDKVLILFPHSPPTTDLLDHQFKTQYRFSEAYLMAQMRDLPPIAGAIIWARQIERQLLTHMKRVEGRPQKRLGALCRRSKTPIRILSTPQKTRHPTRIRCTTSTVGTWPLAGVYSRLSIWAEEGGSSWR